jgi:hypothetical protein
MPSHKSNTIGLAKPDPIFAAIYRCARADEASEKAVRYRRALAKTTPTTLEGVAALAAFVATKSNILGLSFFDNDKELLEFFDSLDRSLVSITRARAAA